MQALGGTLPKARLLGCEPFAFGSNDEPMLELSHPVRDAVTRAVPLVRALALELTESGAAMPVAEGA